MTVSGYGGMWYRGVQEWTPGGRGTAPALGLGNLGAGTCGSPAAGGSKLSSKVLFKFVERLAIDGRKLCLPGFSSSSFCSELSLASGALRGIRHVGRRIKTMYHAAPLQRRSQVPIGILPSLTPCHHKNYIRTENGWVLTLSSLTSLR